MALTTFSEIESFLEEQSVHNVERKPLTQALALARTKLFFELLGNPQDTLKVVHIAGTSGKSSTAFLTNHLLQGLGFKVGLYLSPHLERLTQMIQLNSAEIIQEQFVTIFQQLLPTIEKMKDTEYGPVSNFEILTAMAYLYFQTSSVDYAVIETGWGGTFDATNVVNNPNKLAVITSIGWDHHEILGPTLAQIIQHKLGIIKPGNSVVLGPQSSEVAAIIQAHVNAATNPLTQLDLNIASNISINEDRVVFDWKFLDIELRELAVGMSGLYQAQNSAVALAAVYLLAKRDHFIFNKQGIRKSLQSAHFAGRFEVVTYRGQQLLLDGAHNEPNIEYLVQSLQSVYPGKKCNFLVAFKTNQFPQLLQKLVPLAQSIIATEFDTVNMTLYQKSIPAEVIGRELASIKGQQYTVNKNLPEALEQLCESGTELKIITGSLYLVGEVKKLLV